MFAASDDVKRHVMVSEKKKPVQQTAIEKQFTAEKPTSGGTPDLAKVTSGNLIREGPVLVKREVPDDFDNSPSKKHQGPGATKDEAILLDDD